MTLYSDSKIIDGIRESNHGVINFLYKDYRPLVRAFVRKNSGTIQDADDVFQDGLEALYLRCRDQELILTCALRSYFYSVCRNIWFQRLERKQRLTYYPDLMVNDSSEKYDGRDSLTKEQKLARHALFWKCFKTLPENCQQILLMYIDKVPCKKVAEKLGFTGENYAKVRKSMCVKLFQKRIMKDPEYLNCIDHDQ